ncbi:hypothetical protein ACNFU2_04850 [Chryseobacterium sp. PTM-20240506]|uniref:hypothetical protein n=1 Tax=unclassified Chryseobacterium TaxID=2593645 RepID=UPI0023585296|nr:MULTISPECIES: hypothetical protein [unclassified Chryseobacterium]MDC8104183.1 hypothetical protein [Chryseobacterium sp. B21-037]MDQ1803792.1 hypothetical protein [Chryseobacterium sp. CKR4-1]
MKNKMLNKLKSGYEEMEIKPSHDLWNKIEAGLDEADISVENLPVSSPYKWWKYAAIILFLLSSGILVYFNIDRTKTAHIIAHDKSNEKTETLDNKPELAFRNEHLDHSAISSDIVDRSIATNGKEKERVDSITSNRDHNRAITKDIKVSNYEADHDLHPIASGVQIKPVDLVIPEEEKISENKLGTVNQKTEKKTAKYIEASDLLVGREYDKIQGNLEKGPYIRIELDKLKPHLSKAAVTLGVTVHTKTD